MKNLIIGLFCFLGTFTLHAAPADSSWIIVEDTILLSHSDWIIVEDTILLSHSDWIIVEDTILVHQITKSSI